MSKISVLKYEEEYLKKWDAFIDSSRNGTFLNTRKFLNYQPPGKFTDFSLIFLKKGNIAAVMPSSIINNNDSKILFSHPGSTYGGIIINNKVNLKLIYEIVEKLLEYCKLKDFDKIIIKPPPKFYHCYPSEEIDFALYKIGFKREKLDLTTTIYLKNHGHERGKSMENRTRRAIRSAIKQGVFIEESDNFKEFWDILTENVTQKHGTKPVHTLNEILHLKDLFPKNIKLFMAKVEEKMIGGVVAFITSKTLHTQYIAMLYEYQKLRPINIIFDQLIKYGLQHNYTYLNFGVSTEGFGEEINWGLYDFKESFGGGGFLHEQYSINLSNK